MKDYQISYFAICDLAPIYQNATCEVLHVFQFMVITLTLLLVSGTGRCDLDITDETGPTWSYLMRLDHSSDTSSMM